MCVRGAAVILLFNQLDPLNPKPITEDLPNARPQPRRWRLRQYTQAAPSLPLARSPANQLRRYVSDRLL